MDAMYNIKERRREYAEYLESLKADVNNSTSWISRVSLEEHFSRGISKIEKEVIDAERRGIARCDFYDAEIKKLGKLEKTLSVIKFHEDDYDTFMRLAYDKAKRFDESVADQIIKKLEEIKTMKINKRESLEAFYERRSIQIEEVELKIDILQNRKESENNANHYRKELNLNGLTFKEAYEQCVNSLEKEVEKFAIRVSKKYADAHFSCFINQIKETVEKAKNEGNDTENFYNKQTDDLLFMYGEFVEVLKDIRARGLIKPLEVCYKEQMELMYDTASTLLLNDDRTKKIFEKMNEINIAKRDENETEDEYYLRQLESIQKVNEEMNMIIKNKNQR